MRRCQLSTVNPNFEVFGSRESCDVSKAQEIACSLLAFQTLNEWA